MEKDLRKIGRNWPFELRNSALGRLRLRFDLPSISIEETAEHRFYQLLLNRALRIGESERIRHVVDIGSRNGSYLPALARAFRHASICAVELDGGRRHWSGHRRADYGESYSRALRAQGRDVKYLWKDFKELFAGTLDLPTQGTILFTAFYPFVSEDPCANWGLPSKYADYNSLLHHLSNLTELVPDANTLLISVHQGEWEAERARRAYESVGLRFSEVRLEHAEFASLWPSQHEAFLFRANISLQEN